MVIYVPINTPNYEIKRLTDLGYEVRFIMED
jgi:hypothetical protein